MGLEADRVPRVPRACPTPRLCFAQPTNKLYAGGALSSSNNVAPGPGEMHHHPTTHARWSESSLHARTHALHVRSKAVLVAPHSSVASARVYVPHRSASSCAGTYPTAQSVGKQQSSKKQSAPAFTFSNAKRFVKTGY